MNSKAIMGIGTLIIFIATILVAAVAAGVIISTSGVLQQKALLVGEQAQHRLVNGMEITHVFLSANVTAKTANDVEILARPEPASGPINMRTTSVSFFTDDGAYSATLSSAATVETNISVDVLVDDGDYVAIGDVDGDGENEEIIVVTDGGSADDYLRVNISSLGNVSDLLPLGANIDATSTELEINDLPIYGNGSVYGYIHISDNSTGTAATIDANTMHVTDEIEGDCTFDKVKPEVRYCMVTLSGTDDDYIEYGETVMLYFRLKDENALTENAEFEIKVFPQDGRSTYVFDRVPQVIYKTRLSVYP